MKPWKIGAFVGLLLLVGYCALNTTVTHQVISHDEDAAAKTASQFSQAAFISKDYPQAYNLLGTSFKKRKRWIPWLNS